ncbi:MAG TPA: BON domain-containing protein [Woeseiaceae bacterium]|nr:BON domain-containing protein [Woeseiaceae bacterium]
MLLVGCAGSATTSSTGDYIGDSALTAKVKTSLLESKDTSGTAISVETFKGTVQLSRFVKTEQEKKSAGEITAAVDGAKKVVNNKGVK